MDDVDFEAISGALAVYSMALGSKDTTFLAAQIFEGLNSSLGPKTQIELSLYLGVFTTSVFLQLPKHSWIQWL